MCHRQHAIVVYKYNIKPKKTTESFSALVRVHHPVNRGYNKNHVHSDIRERGTEGAINSHI